MSSEIGSFTYLPSECEICHEQSGLVPCAECGVVGYCSDEHKTAHKAQHNAACKAIKTCHDKVKNHLEKLECETNNVNLAAARRSHILEDFHIQPYLEARRNLLHEICKTKNDKPLKIQLQHVTELMWRCKWEYRDIRWAAPGIMLRLGKDQYCYDFIKRWSRGVNKLGYAQGYLHYQVRNGDIFQSPNGICQPHLNLSLLVSLTLLKIKVLLDLERLEESESCLRECAEFPQELIDMVQQHVPQSPFVNNSRAIVKGGIVRRAMIMKLAPQVRSLLSRVRRKNPHFWPALFNSQQHLQAEVSLGFPPHAVLGGSLGEMQLVLRWTYDSWAETPGAIQFAWDNMPRKYVFKI